MAGQSIISTWVRLIEGLAWVKYRPAFPFRSSECRALMNRSLEPQEARFRLRVVRKTLLGASLVQALYGAMEQETKEQVGRETIQVACIAGCSACCYQMISCTELEYDVIRRYIELLPPAERASLEARLDQWADQWDAYWVKHRRILISDWGKAARDWWGNACPFLNTKNGTCDIYPARPIECRTLVSEITCKSPVGVTAEQYQRLWVTSFFTQSLPWARTLIAEWQCLWYGKLKILPVHMWLIQK